MNLPNKLTLMRLILVPFILVLMLLPYSIPVNVAAFVVFLGASITDMLDGKIARKQNLVTNFGKFLDPLADKFMVIAAVFGLVCRGYTEANGWLFWIFMVMMIVTIFREFAVASIRLVASTSGGVVVAANMLGKIKTVTQIVCICAGLLEPVLQEIALLIFSDFSFGNILPITYLAAAVAVFFTIWSGIVYVTSNWKYIDSNH